MKPPLPVVSRPAAAPVLAVMVAAAAVLSPACGPFPYDGHTGLRLRFESDLPWGEADTLRVWFTTPAGVLLGAMDQDFDLAAAGLSGWGFTVDAYAGDVGPGQLVVHAEARAGAEPRAAGEAAAELVRGEIRDVAVQLVQTAPPPPTLSSPVSITNAPSVVLAGIAAVGATVRVDGGLVPAVTSVLTAGAFSIAVALRPNTANVLVAVTVGPTGLESAPSDAVLVVHDDLPPDAPFLGGLPSVTGATSVTLAGSSEPDVRIDVAGGASAASGQADATGVFSVAVALAPNAVSVLEVTASDAAGNVSQPASVAIEQCSGCITVDPLPPYVRTSPLTVTGIAATFGATIEITGGSAIATGASDAGDGTFAVAVPLALNALNTLDVHEMGSAAGVLVSVTHDDVAPAPPTLNPVASPTSASAIVMDGQAEGGALVELVRTVPPGFGGSATADSSSGAFFVMAALVADTTNTFTLTQTDLAGNVSPPSAPLDVEQVSTLPAAPALDPVASPTSAPDVVISGTVANPGAGVLAVVERGGAATASGPTDAATGAFAITVSLLPDVPNYFDVFSREGPIDSGVATLTVVHDDTPPAMPNGTLITVTAGSCLLLPTTGTVAGMAGAVEPFARVVVDPPGGGANAETVANGTGEFSTTVSLPGSPCSLTVTITALDAAGNASPPLSEPID